jgi:hypothetical protein
MLAKFHWVRSKSFVFVIISCVLRLCVFNVFVIPYLKSLEGRNGQVVPSILQQFYD